MEKARGERREERGERKKHLMLGGFISVGR